MRVLAVVAFVALIGFIVWLMYHNDKCMKAEIERMNEEADDQMDKLMKSVSKILQSNESVNLGSNGEDVNDQTAPVEPKDKTLEDNLGIFGGTLSETIDTNKSVNSSNDSVQENPGIAILDNFVPDDSEFEVNQQLTEGQDDFVNDFQIPKTAL